MTARFIDHLLSPDTLANRPAANAVPVGALYPATDDGVIYQSDGSSWSPWREAGAGSVAALDDLSDVDTATTAPADGDVLTYDTASGLWVPAAPSGGGGGFTLTLPTTKTWTANVPDGIIDYLGKVQGSGAYLNPASGGAGVFANVPPLVVAAQSTNQDSTRVASKAFDHANDEATGTTHTTSEPNPWWRVDFTADRKFQPTRLGIVGRASGGQHPSNFKLQGSNDASTWTDLLTVTGSGISDNTWWSSAIVGAGSYRYLRIYKTDSGYLIIGEVELWGTLSAAP